MDFSFFKLSQHLKLQVIFLHYCKRILKTFSFLQITAVISKAFKEGGDLTALIAELAGKFGKFDEVRAFHGSKQPGSCAILTYNPAFCYAFFVCLFSPLVLWHLELNLFSFM